MFDFIVLGLTLEDIIGIAFIGLLILFFLIVWVREHVINALKKIGVLSKDSSTEDTPNE